MIFELITKTLLIIKKGGNETQLFHWGEKREKLNVQMKFVQIRDLSDELTRSCVTFSDRNL